jgi:hypothetical protein
MLKIAGKKLLGSLIILDSALRVNLQRGKQEEGTRPPAQIANHLPSWYANTPSIPTLDPNCVRLS